MKIKKSILAILSIVLILSLSTLSFAATFEDVVKEQKERNEVTTNEVENKVENKIENNISNSTKNEIEKEDWPDDALIGPSLDDKKEEIEEDGVITFKENISKDVYNASEKDIEYSEVFIDGNVYIMAGEKLVLEDMKIDGNLFAMGSEIVLSNVIIDGSSYLLAENVTIDGQIDSAYICSNNITVSNNTNILKEIKLAGDEIDFEGKVERDFYAAGENIKISDRAEILGNAFIEGTNVNISEEAKIAGEKEIKIVAQTTVTFDKMEIYKTIIADVVIVLIVAIFILNTSPKFMEVNKNLRLRDFVKAFFTGILEIICVIAIFIGLACLGYGIGFGFALLTLTFVLVYFGKMLFIISAGIRLAGKKETLSRIKAFFMTILVLVIVDATALLQLLGAGGFLAYMLISLILGITGFGSIVRVILTPVRRNKKTKAPKQEEVKEIVYDSFIEDKKEEAKAEEIKEEIKEEPKEESKEEVKQEPEEVKEEIKEDKKTEKKTSKTKKEENKEEK